MDVFLTKHNAIISTSKINGSSLARPIMNLLHNASFSVTCLVVTRVHTCPPPGTKAPSPHKGSQPGPPTRGCPHSEGENGNTTGADGRGPGPRSSRPEPARSARAAGQPDEHDCAEGWKGGSKGQSNGAAALLGVCPRTRLSGRARQGGAAEPQSAARGPLTAAAEAAGTAPGSKLPRNQLGRFSQQGCQDQPTGKEGSFQRTVQGHHMERMNLDRHLSPYIKSPQSRSQTEM